MRTAIALLVLGLMLAPLVDDDREDSSPGEPEAASTSVGGLIDTKQTLSALQRLRLHPGRDDLISGEAVRYRPLAAPSIER